MLILRRPVDHFSTIETSFDTGRRHANSSFIRGTQSLTHVCLAALRHALHHVGQFHTRHPHSTQVTTQV